MMFIIDNNISPKLRDFLRVDFPETIHVADLGLDDKEDIEIWDYARDNRYHILTKDGDFNHLQQMKGFPPKVVWLRIGNASTRTIIELLSEKKESIKIFIENPSLGILQVN